LGADRDAPSSLGYHTGDDGDKANGGRTRPPFDSKPAWLVHLPLSPGQAGVDAARRTKDNPR